MPKMLFFYKIFAKFKPKELKFIFICVKIYKVCKKAVTYEIYALQYLGQFQQLGIFTMDANNIYNRAVGVCALRAFGSAFFL